MGLNLWKEGRREEENRKRGYQITLFVCLFVVGFILLLL